LYLGQSEWSEKIYGDLTMN